MEVGRVLFRSRHLPGTAVRTVDPRRAARSRAHRRRRRDADLLPGRDAGVEADHRHAGDLQLHGRLERLHVAADRAQRPGPADVAGRTGIAVARARAGQRVDDGRVGGDHRAGAAARSEEHTSELQSLMSISYAVFCSKKTHTTTQLTTTITDNNTNKT